MSLSNSSDQWAPSDTDVALASVKEQEIQFERLTRELDEVHLTVADQLHQCRVQLSEKMVSVSSEDQVEVSDTESRRDSQFNRKTNSGLMMYSSHQLNYSQATKYSDDNPVQCDTSAPSQPYVPLPPDPGNISMKSAVAHPSAHYVRPAYMPHYPLYRPVSFSTSPHFRADADYSAISHTSVHQYDFQRVHPLFPERHYHRPSQLQPLLPVRSYVTGYQQPPFPVHTYHNMDMPYATQNLHSAGYWSEANVATEPRLSTDDENHIYENINPPLAAFPTSAVHHSMLPGARQDIQCPPYRERSLRHYVHEPNRIRDSSPMRLDEQNKLHKRNDEFNKNDNNPGTSVVIQMLRHPSYQVVANAAAYLQHITFSNDHVKNALRKKGVVPLLVNLLHHHVIQVQRNACGALRNMVYGRSNADAKSAVGKCGGVSSLAHVLRNTEDQEMRDLITGVLWNLSSCDDLKSSICDSALSALASRVIIHDVSLAEPHRMSRFGSAELTESDTVASISSTEPNWSPSFINAAGCLRNISSAGMEVRRKMRNYPGLVEALLLVIEIVVGKKDVDGKAVENCMCVLRNLTYRLATEVESAYTPINRDSKAKGDVVKDEDCWRRRSRREKKKPKEAEVMVTSSELHGADLLWQPSVVYFYLTLLSETCNLGTLEAVTGALQNLSAGQWTWSMEIRATVRKEKGLPMLVEFLQNMESERIVTGVCAALRNMALDERNKELLGKHAMQHFADLLPSAEASTLQENDSAFVFPQPQKVLLLEAACSALLELVTNHSENAGRAHSSGAVPRLMAITKSIGCRYPHRTVKTAGRVLAALWEFKSVRSALKNQGWSRYHFATSVPSITSASSQASPLASAPVSPADVDTFQNRSSSVAPESSPQRPSPQRQSLHRDTASPYLSNHDNDDYVTIVNRDQGGVVCPVDSWV